MAPRRKQGRLAQEILNRGVNEFEVGPRASRVNELNGYEEQEISEVRRRYEGTVGKPQRRLRTVEERLTRLQEHMEERRRSQRPAERRAEAWRELGIQQKITVFRLSRAGRTVLLTALAGVDFHIFANVIAYAEGIEASYANPSFLLGGLLGLMVFGCGYFFGRSVKEWIYVVEQRKLIKETGEASIARAGPDGTRLAPGSPPYFLTFLSGTLFFGLVTISYLMRYRAMTSTDSLYVIMFQAAIPVLVMAVEVFLHDPSHVEPPRQFLRVPILQYLRNRYETTLNRLNGEADAAVREIESFYDVEREMLRSGEQDRNLRFDGAGQPNGG